MSDNEDLLGTQASTKEITPETTLEIAQQPWGATAAFFWGMLIIFLYLVVTMFSLGVAIGWETAKQGISPDEAAAFGEKLGLSLAMDGDFNSINYIVCFFIFTPFLLWLAKKRKNTTTWAYLGFDKLPNKAQMIKYTLIMVAYFVGAYVVSALFNIETPASMVELYNSTDYLILSFIAVVICAPIIEEIFFRGFLFKSWQASKLGVSGTIILTSILFTLIHTGQYDFSILAILFVFALILGFSRYQSGGIYLPIYLHFINNFYSSIEMYFFMN